MEVPTSHTRTGGRGNLIELHVSNVKPGRMAEFLEDAGEVCAFVEANGGLDARVLQLTYAGMSSGLISLIWEHENMTAHAEERRGVVQRQGTRAPGEGTRCERWPWRHGCEHALERDPVVNTPTGIQAATEVHDDPRASVALGRSPTSLAMT